ncbi:MAG: hypothetical protein VX642_12660 [Bdellovibrionota bacterium]|nr:hypothetical protein [Bdellovibrionota bacterium]
MLVSEIAKKNKIGLYKQVDNRNPFSGVVWAAMLGNSESSHFEKVFAETIEENSGYQLTRRSMALRDLVCDLSTLVWDLNYCAELCALFKDESLYHQFSYFRFMVDDIFESWSGGRELPRLICLGGVRKDLKLGDQKYLKTNLKIIKEELERSLEYLLCDRLLFENLDDIGRDFPESLEKDLLWWPELFSENSSYESLIGIQDKNYFKKSMSEFPVLQKDYFDAFSLFRYRVLRIIHSIESVQKNVLQLPEGDYRVVVEHLHIPGNHFLSQKTSSPSGRVYSYYCSGKYRVSSFSRHFVQQISESVFKKDLRQEAWAKLLGVDFVQGVNCESTY